MINSSVSKFHSFDKDIILSRLDPTTGYENFDKTDIIVEAVFEDINIKHKVVKEVEAVSKMIAL